MFFWKGRIQFWQPCWKILAKNPKVFLSLSENVSEISIFAKKLLFLKNFLTRNSMQLWQAKPVEIFPQKFLKFLMKFDFI